MSELYLPAQPGKNYKCPRVTGCVCVCVLSISISTSQCHHAQFQLAAAAPQMMWILQSELAYHAAVVSDNCQKAYEISQAWPETNRGASLTRLLMIHQR